MYAKLLPAIYTFFLAFFIGGNVYAANSDIPTPVGDINVQDFANVLSETEEAELIKIGRSLEDHTTAQVAVLTVQSTGDKTIEEFAVDAFRQYGIGDKQKNNGVLLVLATKDKKVRIEVGYGLEGRIPDGKAGRILDEYAISYLKNEQTNKAVIETYKVVVNEIYAEYGYENQQITVEPLDETTGFPVWIVVIIVVVLLFLDIKFFGGMLSYAILSILSRGGRGGGPRGGGGGSSGGGGASRGW